MEMSTESGGSTNGDDPEPFGSILSIIESDRHIRNLYLKDVRISLIAEANSPSEKLPRQESSELAHAYSTCTLVENSFQFFGISV